MSKYTPLAFEINLRPEGFVFDVGSLFEAFASLHDQRDARGVRYALTTILVFIVLAKLAGENQVRGIAHWVKLNIELLATFVAIKDAPQNTTASVTSMNASARCIRIIDSPASGAIVIE